ncbi:hypothetical protein KBA73_04990 [Patescibacteria group bacterium]|nr:hypothetical protein [Patescibacteria group bacterium]
MSLKMLFPSPVYAVLTGLAVLILLGGSFIFGVAVGERRAGHFANWHQNAQNGFPTGPDHGFGRRRDRPFPFPAPFSNAPMPHVTAGTVLSVNGETFLLQGRNQIESQIRMTSSTQLRLESTTVQAQDVTPGMDATVVGTPNENGQIEARLIRFFRPRN